MLAAGDHRPDWLDREYRARTRRHALLARFRLDTDDNLLARKHVTQVRVLLRVLDTVAFSSPPASR